MKKAILKSVPALNYLQEYPVSVGLINVISTETRRPGQPMRILPYSPDSVLEILLDGGEVPVVSPFEAEVFYTLVDATPK